MPATARTRAPEGSLPGQSSSSSSSCFLTNSGSSNFRFSSKCHIYKYIVAVLRFQKADFGYLVEEGGTVFLDLPKGHRTKAMIDYFLWVFT